MGPEVVEQLRGRAVYSRSRRVRALAAARMNHKGVYFEDLGMAEAVWSSRPTTCR
jgi:fumarate hydratase subunit beta